MRVLLVPHAYAPSIGGVERAVQQLARFLIARVHDVGVLTDRYPDAPPTELLESVRVWRTPFVARSRSTLTQTTLNWPASSMCIRTIVREFHPDVVHLHVTSSNSRYAQYAAKLAGCPLVVTTHGSPDRTLNSAGLRAENELCRSAAALTHCSQGALEQFAVKHPDLQDRSEVIYNGISCSDFDTIMPMALPEPYVLYVGRLDAGKGLDLLLDAWSTLDLNGVRLVVIGDGPLRNELSARAEALHLGGISWLGVQSYGSVMQYLKGAAIFVLPSLSEGFPMSVLEAMAAGRPIVATRVGGIPEQIEDRTHGLLVPAGDSAALAVGIRKLLTEPSLARQLGEQARQRAEDQFDWNRIARQYEAVYLRVCDSSKR